MAMQSTSKLSTDSLTASGFQNETDYNVIIVGAGVAGCSAAYHLMAQQGQEEAATSSSSILRLLVIDAGSTPGKGLAPQIPSGTATMEVAPCVKMMVQLFAGSFNDFVRHHGKEGAKQNLNATWKGLVLQKGIAEKVWVAEQKKGEQIEELGSRDEKELKREFKILSSLMNEDNGIEWCDAYRLSLVEGMSSDFCYGIYFPRDAIIDLSKYAKVVMEYLVKKGKGETKFWPNTTVWSIDAQVGSETVFIRTDNDEGQRITVRKVVAATGALCQFQRQNELLNGLVKPCYSYLVHVPTTSGSHALDKDYCSPNFFTWGYTHDWCFTKGKIRISGEDHFSAYKPLELEERCEWLSKWTLY